MPTMLRLVTAAAVAAAVAATAAAAGVDDACTATIMQGQHFPKAAGIGACRGSASPAFRCSIAL